MMAALNTLSEELRARVDFIQNNESRINNILDILTDYNKMDFSKKNLLSEKGDEIDALAAGLNTLGEELDYSIGVQKKYTDELISTNSLLAESEQRVQNIFNAAPDAVIVIDEESRVMKWNNTAERIFGWSEEEVLGKP